MYSIVQHCTTLHLFSLHCTVKFIMFMAAPYVHSRESYVPPQTVYGNPTGSCPAALQLCSQIGSPTTGPLDSVPPNIVHQTLGHQTFCHPDILPPRHCATQTLCHQEVLPPNICHLDKYNNIILVCNISNTAQHPRCCTAKCPSVLMHTVQLSREGKN